MIHVHLCSVCWAGDSMDRLAMIRVEQVTKGQYLELKVSMLIEHVEGQAIGR